MGRSRQGAGRERDRTWGMNFSSFHGVLYFLVECFTVPGLRPYWSIQTKIAGF